MARNRGRHRQDPGRSTPDKGRRACFPRRDRSISSPWRPPHCSSGSASRSSRVSWPGTAEGDASPSSTARSRRTTRWASITRGGARSRTWSSATGPCAATTSASRTASTARDSGWRSKSRRRSASTRSGRSSPIGLERFSRACRERVLALRPGPDRAVEEAGPVDGLAQLLLHDVRHQHRVQLELSPALPRAWLALCGTSSDAVVHRVAAPRSRSTRCSMPTPSSRTSR